MSIKAEPTLNDLHGDLWINILQFMSLDDLLPNLNNNSNDTDHNHVINNNPTNSKIFGISSSVFSCLFGCNISEFRQLLNDDVANVGGLFYRMLTEKLIEKQLEQVMDRIMNRELFVFLSGDYDEKNNLHISRSGDQLSTFNIRQLNVEPCGGTSMSTLRKELRKCIRLCQQQFPHIYQENSQQIHNALMRSTKTCTLDNSKVNLENKPWTWDEKRREHSITVLETKSNKVKHVQWRRQWIHLYRSYLLNELEYNLSYLEFYFKRESVRNMSQEDCFEIVERIDNILSKFNQEFLTNFYTERNFWIKRTNQSRRNNRRERNLPANVFIDFNTHVLRGLIRIFKPVQKRSDELFVVLKRLIHRHMKLYEQYNRHNLLRETMPHRTIYHYLVKSEDQDLIDEYFTINVQESFKKSSTEMNQSLIKQFIFCTNQMPSFVKSIPFDLVYEDSNNYGLSSSVAVQLLRMGNMNTKTFTEWMELLLQRFGTKQIVESFSIMDLQLFSSWGSAENISQAKNLLGDEFINKLENCNKVSSDDEDSF